MAAQALLHGFSYNPGVRGASNPVSSKGEFAGIESMMPHTLHFILPKSGQYARHGLGAVVAELETELVALETAKPNTSEKPQRVGGGGGGRQRVKARQKSQSTKEPQHTPRLEWLKQEGIDLTNECILDADELCSRSASGLLKLQQTIWRINRSISRSSSVTEALGVIEEMKAAGIDSANEGTYLALITVCRRQQQGERALSIYEAMKQAGVKPGMLTYNTLISCCHQAKRLEDAFRIKAEMEAAGMRPDVVTYTALMALVVKTGPYRGRSSPAQRLGKALELYKEMLERSIRPDAITFNTLMFAGAQAKLPGKVLDIYRMMIDAGVTANKFTFGILLESAGSGGRLKAALEVFNEMCAAGVAPQTSTYNFLIEACASAPHPNAEKAWALYEEMKTIDNVSPNGQTYNHLITASCKSGDHAGALRAHELMRDSGFSKAVTSSTFNKLIQSASKSEGLDSAFQVYKKMREAGYKPDVITFGTLVSACGQGKDLARALTVSEEMESLGIKRNQVVQHALIGAYGQAGQWQNAIDIFRMMQQSGEEQPTALSYGMIFDACFGKEGTNVFLNTSEPGKLEITPGIEAAIGLYEEAVATGFFKNVVEGDLSRCDVRNMNCSGTVVALLAWLLHAGQNPPTSDLIIVTGISKGEGDGKGRKGRHRKKHSVAEKVLQAVGLPCKQLNTVTMQALSVSLEAFNHWLSDLPEVEDDCYFNEDVTSTVGTLLNSSERTEGAPNNFR
ncbi:hypothetical protein CY35_07G102800 [Sphagnum magellanicum]|uniref:Uncharacterized protein n=1 Tax=Sphagnum magellanicum TaxID=128215 RepID=A0ACB8HNI8_9BRYO|nr:hypothetical protein CY35_07G102800 [Sphagnum magellanicum]